jgi:transposase-like protein
MPKRSRKYTIFQNETEARTFLESLRWPKGIRCPQCGGRDIRRRGGKRKNANFMYKCAGGHDFSLTSGTPLHQTPLPIDLWLGITAWLLEEENLTVVAVEQAIGVSHKSTWRMCTILRGAIAQTSKWSRADPFTQTVRRLVTDINEFKLAGGRVPTEGPSGLT